MLLLLGVAFPKQVLPPLQNDTCVGEALDPVQAVALALLELRVASGVAGTLRALQTNGHFAPLLP